jgi:signal peptidase I
VTRVGEALRRASVLKEGKMRLGAMVAVLGGLIAVKWACPLQLAVVSGDSMAPTLRNGQLVLIDRAYYQSQPVLPDEVVALRMDGEVIIKRVTWVGQWRHWRSGGGSGGAVLVRGDAPEISWDSRSFGPVSTESIIGRVIGFAVGERPNPQVARAEGRSG